MNRILSFFQDGVYSAIKSVVQPKPMGALVAGTSSMVLPPKQAVLLFRTVAHESAHALEAKSSGATVEGIKINYNPLHMFGETIVDNTTPLSARKISLAGIGLDVGFILGSWLILKRIAFKIAIIWLVFDLVSFLYGADYKIYLKAKRHMKKGKERHE